jgi:thiol-disulfide isomerase/thioredoxin
MMAWRCALLFVPLVAASCGTGAGSDSADVLAVEFSDFASGESATLDEYRGTPLVVNLWASWCPSCIHEMPDFEEVSQEYAGRIEFVGIGIDDDRGAAEQLVEETGVTYRLGIDDNGVFTDLLGAVAMPTTAFIGANGKVIEVRGGQLSADALRAQIEEHLLAGGGGDITMPGIDVTAAASDAADTFDPAYLYPEAGLFPALDDPALVPAASASWLESDDIVMGIAAPSGEAQAYPVDQMAYHHVANTRLAGEPFVVTY